MTEIRSIEDIKGIIGDTYPLMAPYINFTSGTGSPAYCIEATGYKSNPKTGYAITVTVAFDSLNQYHYLYYKSPADITP